MQLDDEGIVRLLDSMPQEQPPPELRGGIRRGVSGATRVPRFDGGRQGHRSTFLYAWAAAAAIVLGFFLFGPTRNGENPTATMAPAAVTITQTEDLITIGVSTPGSISVRWDPNSADLVGISGGTGASSWKHQTTFSLGPSGRAAVALRARPAATSVEVSVSVDGLEIRKQVVPVNKRPTFQQQLL